MRSMKAHKVASRSGVVRVTSNLQVMDVTGSSNREVDLSNAVLRKKFDSMVNLDGKINKEAMRELLQCSETLRISNDWLSDDEMDSLLERYTQNGVLTYENFVSIAEDSVMVAAKIEELMIAFTMIDHEGEGKVGKEDLSLLFRQLGQKVTDKDLDKIFEEADTNKNGVISFTEFLFMARSHLVDLAEVLAYVQLEKGPKQLGIPKSMQRKVAVSRMRTELKEQWAGAFPEGEDASEEGAAPPTSESAEQAPRAPEPPKEVAVEVNADAVVHKVSGEADIRTVGVPQPAEVQKRRCASACRGAAAQVCLSLRAAAAQVCLGFAESCRAQSVPQLPSRRSTGVPRPAEVQKRRVCLSPAGAAEAQVCLSLQSRRSGVPQLREEVQNAEAQVCLGLQRCRSEVCLSFTEPHESAGVPQPAEVQKRPGAGARLEVRAQVCLGFARGAAAQVCLQPAEVQQRKSSQPCRACKRCRSGPQHAEAAKRRCASATARAAEAQVCLGHTGCGSAQVCLSLQRALLGEKDRLCVLMVGFTFCRPCKRFTRPYEPTEKDAGTQTDISGVSATLEDRTDRRNWSHPVFVPCKCRFDCPYWDPREPYKGCGRQTPTAFGSLSGEGQVLGCERRSRSMTGQRGAGGSRRMSSPEVTRTLDQYRRAAVWCTRTRIAAVAKLMELAQPSRATTKVEVLEDRRDMLIEFQRLEDAILEDMPRDLEGPTDDLVEVGILGTDRRVVRGEWPLGEPGARWEALRGVAAKDRRRVLAWATAASDMQQELRPGSQASPNGSGSPGSSGPSPKGVLRTEDEVQRMVDAAVAAALAGRGVSGQGGSRKQDPPASLRELARASAGKRRGWSWAECERVITEIRVAAARQAADLARVKHSFGRHPARRVEPWEFELVDSKFPACKEEQCGLEELPERAGVRTRHLYAYIDLALKELADMQQALASVPGIAQPAFDEEWAAAAARSKKRRAVKQHVESDGEDSESEERKRAAAKARFGSLRTATDEELRRALHGSLAVKDITRPPGEIAVPARPFLPAGGALKGMDIRVSRPGGDYEEGAAEWRLDAKKGLVLEAKAKHCRSFDEWDENFTVLACKAPEDARDLLLQFRKWMRLMSFDYAWDHLRKFYDHLCARMEKEASTTFELVSYTAHWEMYKRDKGIKEKGHGGGGGGGSGSWTAGGTGSRYPKKPRVPDTEQPDASAVKPDKPEGEIVVEPEEEREDGVTMASGDREPEPAGETCEMQVEDAEPWWTRLRRLLVAPVWDAAGAPLPAAPAAVPAPAVSPAGTGCGEHYPAVAESRSARWPALRAAIVEGAKTRGLSGTGTTEEERARFQQEVRDVGAQVPLMSERAHLLAEALKDWPDVAFLVRGAACGVGFPFAGEEPEEPYVVENYVGDEHAEAMTAELAKEMAAGRIFDARDWLPRGVSALGMVERLRKGKLKYRPVWDYSRPSFVGVNDWIELQKDEFTSVKDAYALLRPGMYMVKVDLEEAYRSLPVASQYWAAQCFQWRGKRYMDTRSPFGNRALPGIFMRYTRAIVAWMQAQGVPCVGYLDDFFMVARTAAAAQEMMDLMIEFVTMLGFKVNRAKCEGPARRMEFLGVLLCTDGETCTASIGEDRVQQVTDKVREMRAAAATGPVRRRKLESLLGLLAFCSQVVWGLSLYTRQGFALVAATAGRSRVTVNTGVMQDLKVVERVIRLYNGRKVVLHKEDVHEDAFATDASLRKGMGGHCRPDYFLISWEDLAEMPQRDFYPFTSKAKSHINYLELFAVWWALALWAHRLSGWTLVVRIDNQCALTQVDKFWGPVEYIPLLRKIFYLCAQHDIRLRPKYIASKDNLLADLLSRLKLEEFHMRWAMRKREVLWRQDRDDWQFSPVLFAEMDEEFGPFTLDACVASSRANAFCVRSWSAEDDARKQSFDGLNTWANLPFSVMYEILRNFLKCKRRQQMGTGGCFLVPVWEGDEAYELVSGMREVFRPVRKYRAGTMLFTAPALDGKGRSEWGPTRWDVLVDGAYAESTQRSYDTGVKAFLTFCVRFACLGTLEPLLPASDATLARFIAFSAWFVQPGTIKSYLAGVRSLHLQQGVEWTPVAHRFRVAAALQGVRRQWDRPAKPVMPITLRDLARMAEFADMESITGLALWAAILVGFYGLFRKDNLTVGKSQAWNARGALVREDVLFAEDGDVVWIRVRHSKTIQCGERYHWVPLVAVPGSRLCPVEALRRLMLATEGLPDEAPLFQVEGRGKRGALVPMAHAALVAGLKSLAVQVGLDPARYAGHSLRRGVATAAMRLKVEKLYIKLQGDWKSDCWERYCELDDEQRLILPAAFAEAAKELS
ncbi:hypothetical protein CYMTET_41342 [Cymbomonas tetramitiformis]|uniref:Uncharacterized protein n=1 Tax=Cymbomonas tetramitiformis TaxID=36881 RepID=A0AAE0C687_9CHLO|nr:hypothetical protein CYMTET_41342 [Cymbomonas tetramitiformis]